MTLIAAVVLTVCLAVGCDRGSSVPTPEPSDIAADSHDSSQPDTSGPALIEGGFDSVDWASLVDQSVRIEGPLVVVDTYDLIRRGQLKLARERLFVPTSQIDPNDVDPAGDSFEGGSNVANVTAAQAFNDAAVILVDDDSDEQNLFPPRLIPELGKGLSTLRVGSRVESLSGRVVQRAGKYAILVKTPLAIEPAPRPPRPDVGDADVTIASFNVLNYFTTIDDGQNGARGADSPEEFERQQTKLVSAMRALDADVIGLMELENNAEAESALVKALNEDAGETVYAACGTPDGFSDSPGGSNAIRVGIVYRADRVEPVGDVAMIRDEAFTLARTPIVQTFKPIEGGKPFTVMVNHFKSKGGRDADPANKNKGDGQAAFNAARREQSLAIRDRIKTLAESESDGGSRVLVIGDLNAYQQEDPIDALRAGGLVDLHEQFGTVGGELAAPEYSYLYYGQCGSLDHAFATPALAADVTGVATWHINADEPRFVDYNQEYNPAELYDLGPYRCSDHDPVLIGIRCR